MKERASFGAYQVVRKIGQGGMGEVYQAEHALIGRRAAIKVLKRERAGNGEALERFFKEARATSAMADPGIVQIYDFGVTDGGVAYLVMEYLDGESLAYRLRRRSRLSSHEAVRIARQLAGSLAATHAAGIVHRDLKPENVFIVRDGEALGGERPKILDFGIAKLGDENVDTGPTRTGQFMGTPAYMSPEQCNDASGIDHRTDIYSLGCVLFHMLAGRPPFDHAGVGEIIAGHLRETPPAPSTLAPDVPAILDPLVARCLAKRPDQRFATMLELQQACEAALAHLPAPTSVPELAPITPPAGEDKITTLGNSVGESQASPPVRIGVWAGIAIAAVAAGIVLAVTTTRHGASDRPQAPAEPAVAAPPAAAPRVEVTPIEVAPPVPEPAPPATVPQPPPVAAPPHPTKKPPARPAPKKPKQPGELYEDRT